MKIWLRRLVLLVLSTLLSLALLEGLLTAYAWTKYGTININSLTSLETGNTYAQDEPAGFAATLYPHPYVTYVRNETIEGRLNGRQKQHLNNIGLIGRDYPIRRNPAKFTILLMGGSVAEQVAKAGQDGQSYLEIALNQSRRFDRPVEVLNGANGGWRQPQQAIMMLLYADVVDAVITLDGFNERTMLSSGRLRLEDPSNLFFEINPLAGGSFNNLAIAWQCQELKQLTSRHPWRSVYFATRTVRQLLESRGEAASLDDSGRLWYRLPREWSPDDIGEFNFSQYEKYIRSIDELADLHGSRRAFVLQPCPAIGKPLTAEELNVVGNLDYRDEYLSMESRLLKLRDEAIPTISLTDAFEDCRQTLYDDKIHCKCDSMTDVSHEVNFWPSEGYRILSEALAERLIGEWFDSPSAGQEPK